MGTLISLTGFMRKWAETARVPGMSAVMAFELQEDLQRLIEYAGGDVEKSFNPTQEEADRGLVHPRESESRRKLEYDAFLAAREARRHNQSAAEAVARVEGARVEGGIQPPAGPAVVDTPSGPAASTAAARGGRRA